MIDEIPEEGIPLGETIGTKGERRPVVGNMAAFLSDPALWDNWEDKNLYECERMIRDWMAEMCKVPKWRASNAKCRRYTFSMAFQLVTGERYVQKKHARYIHAFTRVLAYYSSRVQKSGSIDGKFHSKTIYNLSPRRLERPPLSLRLRFEWLAERGVRPTKANMQNVDADVLRPGHARNPRTDEHMRERREAGRARYNERYRDRAH